MDVDDRLPTKYPILYVVIAAFQTGIWVRWCLQIRRMWPLPASLSSPLGVPPSHRDMVFAWRTGSRSAAPVPR